MPLSRAWKKHLLHQDAVYSSAIHETGDKEYNAREEIRVTRGRKLRYEDRKNKETRRQRLYRQNVLFC